MSSLTIISHTKHYKKSGGSIVGFGSTIIEINHLLEVFDSIVHVAMLHDTVAPPSALPYVSKKVTFIALPAVGGKKVSDKISILYNTPKILRTIQKTISQTDYFQFRAPTGIGVFVIPYLVFFSSKKGWFKYAGNWKQENASLSYSFQRWLLKKQKKIVTVNGNWKNQPNNIVAFENPCLTELDREKGREIIENKQLKSSIHYCFVGGLNINKGILRILEAFQDSSFKSNIYLHIVGSGNLLEDLKKTAKKTNITVCFYGNLSKEKVQEVYAKSNFIILASQTEGFPKVIGEAMNFGCVPLVSNVSAIPQYIKNKENGFLFNPLKIDSITSSIKQSILLTNANYSNYVNSNYKLANIFTYAYYLTQVKTKIFKL